MKDRSHDEVMAEHFRADRLMQRSCLPKSVATVTRPNWPFCCGRWPRSRMRGKMQPM